MRPATVNTAIAVLSAILIGARLIDDGAGWFGVAVGLLAYPVVRRWAAVLFGERA